MTTIPGHNIVIQQSGRAHDATHHLKPVQPDPEHLQGQQTVRESLEQTTIQSSENTGKLNADANPENREKIQRRRADKKNKKKRKAKREQYPETPGNLLNTVV